MARSRRELPGSTPAHFRAIDLERTGVSRNRLRRWVDEGLIEQIGRGLYRRATAPVTEFETVAIVAAAVPHAVVCLLTALAVHGIGTHVSRAVWIAIDRKHRRPSLAGVSLRTVRFSPALMESGIETRHLDGVRMRVTTPARTVVDCFRYRNKIGLDVALEAMRDAVRSRKATIGEIAHFARACRVAGVVGPYLDVLAV